jgi:hypothetical protein
MLSVHSSGWLHLFRGSCTWVAFARCVELLPLPEGLAIFGFLSFASGVEPVASSWGLALFYLIASSHCPCLWGPSFTHFKWPRFGFSLAFDHLVKLFVFSSSSFSFAQVVRVLVLPMHSSRGRLRTQGWNVPLCFILWWVIVNVTHEEGWVAKAMCATCLLACVV